MRRIISIGLTTPITPRVASALGDYTAKWNLLEHQFSLLLATLLDIEPVKATIILANFQSGRSKRDLISSAAANYLHEDHLPRLRSLMRRAKKFARYRNCLVHGVYRAGSNDESNTVTGDSADNGPWEPASKEITETDVRQRAEYVGILAYEILIFSHRLKELNAVYTLPKIHREQQTDHAQ